MIAVDTNVLVYAHRPDAPFHESARACIKGLAEGRAPWVIPWPCLHEFVAVTTHPRIFAPPSPLPVALDQVSAWLESPTLMVLAESGEYWPILTDLATTARAVGPLVHDARIAALCVLHGVRELWSADRDFGRFPGLTVRNPLLADGVSERRASYGTRRRSGARPRRAAARL
jgi:toxin-antitoxin system PIN domain toxin